MAQEPRTTAQPGEPGWRAPARGGRHATEAAAGLGLLALSWLLLADRTDTVPREADVFGAVNGPPRRCVAAGDAARERLDVLVGGGVV